MTLPDSGQILRLDVSPAANGRDVARQYYAVIEGRLALIRLEDHQGELIENIYDPPDFAIGPRVPDRTPQEWEQALLSNDPAEILRSLVWLGGWHVRRGTPEHRVSGESRAGAELADRVLHRPLIQRRVCAELQNSAGSNPWIRQAARRAEDRIAETAK